LAVVEAVRGVGRTGGRAIRNSARFAGQGLSAGDDADLHSYRADLHV
jgi:hypothetical protein